MLSVYRFLAIYAIEQLVFLCLAIARTQPWKLDYAPAMASY
ncbi:MULTISPECIES: hypothetical protein [unclassified Microcoleus]|nr:MULTISPECIES: hypothetical protein [unclassified Microcoleus]